MGWISAILEILKNVTTFCNREAESGEKLKDASVSTYKKHVKAIAVARKMFVGDRSFIGLDLLLKEKLSENEYKKYKKLRSSFNKYAI